MKTLFAAYRVTDLDRSPGFCTALGYVELGRVEAGGGTRLVILKFPGRTGGLSRTGPPSRRRTKELYQDTVKALRERLGEVKLRELTAGDVQETLDALAGRLSTRR